MIHARADRNAAMETLTNRVSLVPNPRARRKNTDTQKLKDNHLRGSLLSLFGIRSRQKGRRKTHLSLSVPVQRWRTNSIDSLSSSLPSQIPDDSVPDSSYPSSGCTRVNYCHFHLQGRTCSSSVGVVKQMRLILLPSLTTIADCSFVTSSIGPSYHPQREMKVTEDDEGSGVGLMDRFRTHWRKGKMNYNAISGIGRCRTMQDPQPEQAAS